MACFLFALERACPKPVYFCLKTGEKAPATTSCPVLSSLCSLSAVPGSWTESRFVFILLQLILDNTHKEYPLSCLHVGREQFFLSEGHWALDVGAVVVLRVCCPSSREATHSLRDARGFSLLGLCSSIKVFQPLVWEFRVPLPCEYTPWPIRDQT